MHITYHLQRFGYVDDPCRRYPVVISTVERHNGMLFLQYRVEGGIDDLALPLPQGAGRRRHGLWQHTCFECFMGVQGEEEYREFNLASNGDWNVYRFSGYRAGMIEETMVTSLPFAFYATGNAIRLELKLDFTSFIHHDRDLEVGLSAVLEHRSGVMSYWALRHCGSRPDFHHRSAFLLKL